MALDPAGISAIINILLINKDYINCFASLLVYDYLITLPVEVRFIWGARWSAIKVAFLINRYYTLFQTAVTCYLLQTDVPVEACARLGRIELGGITVTVISCSAILSIRLYALYERNIFVLAGLIALMIVELIIMAITTSRAIPVLLPKIILPGCVLSGHNSTAWMIVFWSFPLLFNTIIMILTIVRVRYYKKLTRFIPILRTFIADAGFYYIVIVGVNFVNVAFYFTKNNFSGLNSSSALVLTSLMSSRIVLNLHQTNLNIQSSDSSQNGRLTERDEIYLASLSPQPTSEGGLLSGKSESSSGTGKRFEWSRRDSDVPISRSNEEDIELGRIPTTESISSISGIRVDTQVVTSTEMVDGDSFVTSKI